MDRLDEDSRRILAVTTGGFAALTVTLWTLRLAYALFNAPLAHLVTFLGLLLGICLAVGLGVLVDTPSKTTTEEPLKPVSLRKPLPDIEEEMDETVRITQVAQRQAAASYVNINREVSAFFQATEELENKALGMTPESKRSLHKARLDYFDRLANTAREGQQIIQRYLREI